MTTFALISEGITDRAVIEVVIEGYFGHDDFEVLPLQPPADATDQARQGDFGGWEKVFQHCSDHKKMRDAILSNDFVIIHLDTDAGEHARYGLPKTQGGKARPVAELRTGAIEILKSKIGTDIIAEHGDKIIFAIAVHSIDCWLLPIYAYRKLEKSKILECESALRRHLARKDIKLDKKYSIYLDISAPYAKKKNLAAARKMNESLDAFVDQIDQLGLDIDPATPCDLPRP